MTHQDLLQRVLEALRNVPAVGEVYDKQHADTHLQAALLVEDALRQPAAQLVWAAPLPTADEVMSSPGVRYWVKDALRAAIQRDPVDAVHDAALIHQVLENRLNNLFVQGDSPGPNSECCLPSEFLDRIGDYDAVEIQGVSEVLCPNGQKCCEADNLSPEFYSVYLHLTAGGVECVRDFARQSDAREYAAALGHRFNWPVYDYSPA